MTCLYVVPNVYVRNFRRSLSGDASVLVMTMPGLVAQILKEGLVSYKEDKVLEEVAIWQSVQDHAEDLTFFAPIAHYPGFIQELKWLFRFLKLCRWQGRGSCAYSIVATTKSLQNTGF